jgi:hypothetical protein
MILDNKLDLKLLYPHRSTFHVTEYLAFSSVMVDYYMRIGEHEAARTVFRTMEQIDPDHEMTDRLRDLLETSLLLRALRKFKGFGRTRTRGWWPCVRVWARAPLLTSAPRWLRPRPGGSHRWPG